jgi:chromosome segregation ATPase
VEEAAARHQAEREAADRAAAKLLDDHKAQHERALALAHGELVETKAVADAEHTKAIAALHAEREAADRAAAKTLDDHKAHYERALALAHGEVVKTKAVADAEHAKAVAALHADHERQRKEAHAEHERQRKEALAEHGRIVGELTTERDELRRGLSSARDTARRNETELASAVQTIADRNAELRAHAAAVAERDQRLADLRREIEGLERENASYQEQVLRAYQKIKTDEAMVARAKKAMAIALTVLDDQGNPKAET